MNKHTIYALGFFDGVHLGHQVLLRACRTLAESTRCNAGAVTFSSHPESLTRGQAPLLLNTPSDRRQLLRHYGMETVVELPFDEAMRTMPWQNFFRLLVEKYQAAGFVCGHDFQFGHKGEGTAETLQAACEKAGIPCTVVPQQQLDDVVISSSYIRQLLLTGNLQQANRFLGHPHRLTGKVIAGRGIGRTMGIPTANLLLPDTILLPANGVYACQVLVEKNCYTAVTNIGCRPTVGGHHVTVEPWLLDFNGDLYGKELTVLFYAYLRPEQTFDSLTQLQAEIQKNALQTRKIIEKT